MDITEDTFEAASRRGATRQSQSPAAVKAWFDSESARVVIEFNSGLTLSMPSQAVEGLSQASAQDLSRIEISPSGMGIHFPDLDVDLYIPALLQGFLGTKQWMAAQMGKAGGQATSPAKGAAARANGKLGGRPKKIKLAA